MITNDEHLPPWHKSHTVGTFHASTTMSSFSLREKDREGKKRDCLYTSSSLPPPLALPHLSSSQRRSKRRKQGRKHDDTPREKEEKPDTWQREENWAVAEFADAELGMRGTRGA